MSIIVATGVYALLLKFLQKNSPHNVQMNGGGVKGFLNNVKKTALFLYEGFPNKQNIAKGTTDPRVSFFAFVECFNSINKSKLNFVSFSLVN